MNAWMDGWMYGWKVERAPMRYDKTTWGLLQIKSLKHLLQLAYSQVFRVYNSAHLLAGRSLMQLYTKATDPLSGLHVHNGVAHGGRASLRGSGWLYVI